MGVLCQQGRWGGTGRGFPGSPTTGGPGGGEAEEAEGVPPALASVELPGSGGRRRKSGLKCPQGGSNRLEPAPHPAVQPSVKPNVGLELTTPRSRPELGSGVRMLNQAVPRPRFSRAPRMFPTRLPPWRQSLDVENEETEQKGAERAGPRPGARLRERLPSVLVLGSGLVAPAGRPGALRPPAASLFPVPTVAGPRAGRRQGHRMSEEQGLDPRTPEPPGRPCSRPFV
ncbi:basic salivary proline-rich protein 3-like isoform X1 [Canis lupus familiaris]|uniref:basic salivary proline-rich protein 3-like isoform X1 n=1 Tax=Canis lupus familiaris TaxID=9615 RepID=UPI0015F1AB36|nr:basic salivary proline-rich protein 3-like isoform X1 [Canis lupus familiaris]XP_038319245.1 basic salivary proline-rich protein 3-like isoform X1 [Canis lupus familiaris]